MKLRMKSSMVLLIGVAQSLSKTKDNVDLVGPSLLQEQLKPFIKLKKGQA